MTDFRIKYRPSSLSEVWGNESVKSRWQRLLVAKAFPKAILLSGNFGVGKTSLAKIFGKDILSAMSEKAGLRDGFHEFDSTTYDSDKVRSLLKNMTTYVHGTVVLFFDEFQRMPSKAQEILLKPIEEADGIFFILATTNMESIDGGILSRSTKLVLSNPPKLVLVDKLAGIAELENIEISEEALEYLVESSNYSPRECLGNLQSLVGFVGHIEISTVLQILKPI